MNISWTAEMEEGVARAGDAPARIQLRGDAFVLLPADDYAWVRGMVRDVPEVQRVVDPNRGLEHAVVPLKDYERIKPLFEEDPLTIEEQRAALRAAGLRAGWNDPAWDDLEAETPPS